VRPQARILIQSKHLPEGVMEILRQLILLSIAISLIGMEVSLGMQSGHGELLYVLRRPGLLLRALLAVNVIVPIAALVMVSLFPLSPAARGGILVMAASSVPPLAPDKALHAGAGKSYAFGLYTAIVLLSVVMVPATVALISGLYHVSVPLSPLPVAREVLEKVVLPVLAGLAIGRFAPNLAERLAPIIARVASVVLMIAVVPILITVWPAMMGLIGNGTILAMALVASIALAGGQLLGGRGPTQGAALATMAATRHPGLALTIVGAMELQGAAKQREIAAIIAFLLVGMVVAIPYQRWLKRHATPSAPGGAVPA
jgi:BASS family bile acid:Na+ symporter